MQTQTLVNNQVLNAGSNSVSGAVPAGSVAVKLSVQLQAQQAGSLDANASLYDSDDGVTWTLRGELHCRGTFGGSLFVIEDVRSHYRVDYALASRTTATVVVTFFAADDPIQ